MTAPISLTEFADQELSQAAQQTDNLVLEVSEKRYNETAPSLSRLFLRPRPFSYESGTEPEAAANSSNDNAITSVSVPSEWNPLVSQKFATIPVPYRPPFQRFKVLQQWEGCVIEILNDSFVGRIADRTEGETIEEAEFDLEEISDDDRSLVEIGAIFYWNIGYLEKSSGRTRVSEIRFRRLPAWTQVELEEAKKKAQATREELGWG